MSRSSLVALSAAVVVLVSAARPAPAQDITLPPSGDNQKCSVTQSIGLATIRIDYSSPDVHGPDGADRRGKIWGELVPWGLHDLQFNDCANCPWRAGANENTVFTVSHDVLIEGQPLPAGSYGLHMLADPKEWTLIFSKDNAAWGSYSYDPSQDALRVKVKPAAAEYNEWLTYEFTDRRPAQATVALKWEDLQIPWTISIPGMTDLYIQNLRRELRGDKGFNWQNLRAAANFCLQERKDLEEALAWARKAVEMPGVGQRNFETLTTLAQLQATNDFTSRANQTIDEVLALSPLDPLRVHGFARGLQQAEENELALRVFQANARRFPNQWPVELGLARGYAALEDRKAALSHARKALTQAPDEANRKSVQRFIDQLQGPPAGR